MKGTKGTSPPREEAEEVEAAEASSRSEDRRRPPWNRFSYTGSNQTSSNFSMKYSYDDGNDSMFF